MQGSWVQSLVGELRTHRLCGVAKKKKKLVLLAKLTMTLEIVDLGLEEREGVWRQRAQ